MTDKFSYLFVGVVFGVLPLMAILFFHLRIFLRYLRIILLMGTVALPLLLIPDEIGYRLNHFVIRDSKIIGPRISYVPLEDIFFALVCIIIIPLVTILLKKAYEKPGRRFRDILFKKDEQWQ